MPKEKKFDKICAYCHKPFPTSSAQAKYCTPGHRVMAWKVRHNVSLIDWSKESPFKKTTTPVQIEYNLAMRQYEDMKHQRSVVLNDIDNAPEILEWKKQLEIIEKKYTHNSKIKFDKLCNDIDFNYDIRQFMDKLINEIAKETGENTYNIKRNYFHLIKIKSQLIQYCNEQIQTIRAKLAQQIIPLENRIKEQFEKVDLLSRGVSLEHQQQSGQILSGEDLLNMEFDTYEFEPKFYNIFGNPSKNFVAMVHGNPGSGKSTFAIQFASYFKAHIGSCVYCSIEEGISYSLQQKIASNTKYGSFNISQDKSIKEIKKLNHHQLIVIDSVTSGGFSPADIKELITGSDNTAFLLVFHNTKEGIYKGDSEFLHLVDINLTADKGIVTADGKHRFSDNIMTKSYTIFS